MSTATSTSTALKRVLDLTHSNQTHPTPTVHLARALSFVALPTWPGSRSHARHRPNDGQMYIGYRVSMSIIAKEQFDGSRKSNMSSHLCHRTTGWSQRHAWATGMLHSVHRDFSQN
ncbi:hypothetical protein QC764_105580 [Podospora pseudoanserina]|uniref:Uncharacterized protein n=1 Tax=Podospora pseudoanserina TaxID=2609844 RepID=A0ABR0ILD9_9PEZI|nr:hypothetical protein QC764_105580 [Podospora pseudoanserina]